MAEKVTLKFDKERETKNKVRYKERERGEGDIVVGTLYIDKNCVADRLESADSLVVTVEAD